MDTFKNLENKVQEKLENLNDKLDDFSQKYNEISLETKNNTRRSTKMSLNSLYFISICVFILTFITYTILKHTEPELIKEKIKNTYEVSSLKLFTYSFVIGIFLTIFLYFVYYFYRKFKV